VEAGTKNDALSDGDLVSNSDIAVKHSMRSAGHARPHILFNVVVCNKMLVGGH